MGEVKLPTWEVGVSSVVSSGSRSPFWLVSNRHGKILPDRYAGIMEIGISGGQITGRNIEFSYGMELLGRVGESSDFWLHQAYGKLKLFDYVQMRFGLWEETLVVPEPSLSSGSIIWSGNARPMPKIEIGTPGFIAVPFTKGYAEISGLISHGWFENERFVKDLWLHHKNLHFRLGGSLPLNITYGINHFAQWGGQSPWLTEPFPTDFKNFMRIFRIQAGDPLHPGTPVSESLNRLGNHIGSRNYGLELKLGETLSKIYYQDLFEDNSGRRRRNFPDGLWGLKISVGDNFKPLTSVVYEFLHTESQSGPSHDVDGITVGGNDNYFNHGFYRSGWTHHRYTIGTPLITSPILNETFSYEIMNNRVIAHHIGFEGSISSNLKYRNLITYSRNFGTYHHPFSMSREQFSWMVDLTHTLGIFGLEAGAAFALDLGEMNGNNFGLLLSLRKSGSF